ncbi:hypothetical protein ACRW5E_21285 [Escherichia coli]|uniref:hypothetical protein n=1 Tax=Escherichia coli TaxID=562 RepID=UPI0016507893|nr:hypothetical protein [Escherichia coli]MBC1013227.1 hypothetical protein [Escherichia coli]MBS9237886.1 hypothetical protein [Escherichia coli]HCN8310448.1 hypothetical protein [Escherichia coli]HCO7722214.1 hypothetical protein [Escherichia coli]
MIIEWKYAYKKDKILSSYLKNKPLLPDTNQLHAEFGERLKLALLRRKLTAKLDEGAGISPMTLRSLDLLVDQ